MIIVQIHRDGAMDEIEVEEVTDSSLQALSKSQGEGHIRPLYEWTYGSSLVSCFGWYDGEAGFENKHELPPSGHSKFLEEDSSTILLFGDIFLCLSEQNKDKDKEDFDISMCGEFYHKILGGFDECDSLDSEEEDGQKQLPMTEDGDVIDEVDYVDDVDDVVDVDDADYVDDADDVEDTGETIESEEEEEEEAVETEDEDDNSEEEYDLNYEETVLEEDDYLYENEVDV